jgi:drug/metabolite transporter (DMT)-like permease
MFIIVAVLALFFLKEKLSKKIFIPAVLLLAGNFLLLKLSSFEFGLGAAFVLAATFFWAVENVISKKVLVRIEPKTVAFGRLFFGSLFILAYLFVIGKAPLVFSLSFSQFSWILVTVPFLLLYVITWYTGLKEISVTTATSILLLGSPITTLLSFVFLGSALGVMQAIGMLLILSGVSMVILIEKKSYSANISIA